MSLQVLRKNRIEAHYTRFSNATAVFYLIISASITQHPAALPAQASIELSGPL